MSNKKQFFTAKFLLMNGDIFEINEYAETKTKAQNAAHEFMKGRNQELPVTSPKRIRQLIGVV